MGVVQNNIAAVIAVRVNFAPNLKSYEDKIIQLKVNGKMTSERSKALKERYAFLN